MDELSPLFQEIEFHERFRGYDPDEVDAYVDRVAKAAALLRGRLAELHERVDAAEARSSGSTPTGEIEETLTRTLVLAQRTADAAIAEAREESERMTTDAASSAQAILSAAEAEAQVTLREAQAEASSALRDAEDRAARMLAEAETDRRALVAEAERVAAAAASTERERLVTEVAELHQYRAFLADDIEILERHLDDERRQLTSSLSALHELLESPESFRSTPAPATSGIEIDERLLESAPVSEAAASETPVEPEEAGTIDLVAEEGRAEEPFELEDAPGGPIFDPGGEPEAAEVQGSEIEIDLDQQEPEPTTGETTSPPRLVTAADLEDPPTSGSQIGFDPGPATAPHQVISETSLFTTPSEVDEDPFLTQLRTVVDVEPMPEGDDEALSAFFDQEEEEDSRSWFGRRR